MIDVRNMIVPTGPRDLHLPGSHLNRDGQQGRPMLAHLGEPFTEVVYPSLEDPIDDTWMRLDPVTVSEAECPLPIIYSTTVPDDVLNERRRMHPCAVPPPARPEDLVHTVGPFKSERFVQAVRGHQHRRLSLTLASGPGDEFHPTRYRFFDVRVALDVDLRLLRGPAFWLDWLAYPVGEDVITAAMVHKPLERTA